MEKNLPLPLLSVVVPAYNAGHYLQECLLSIVRQDYPAIEILVVDDGSTDNTLEVARGFSAATVPVRVFTQCNGGASAARNLALNCMKGTFVTFVDADDVLLSDDIYSRILACFAEDEQADVVQYDVIHHWGDTSAYKRQYPFKSYNSPSELALGYLTEQIHGSCCDKVFRAKVWHNLRFPVGQQAEDIAVIPQIIEQTRRLITTPIGCYGYRFREESTSNTRLTVTKMVGVLASYHAYYAYTSTLPQARALSIVQHTNMVWNYCSAAGKFQPGELYYLLDSPVFLRIGLGSWLQFAPRIGWRHLLKTFIATVLGPDCMAAFQRIFTR